MAGDSEEESPSSRQEQEVEVLKAIYESDFSDLRDNDVWKVRRPPEFTLRVTPSRSGDSDPGAPGTQRRPNCEVVLRVKLDEEYPLSPPAELAVVKSEGLSNELAARLLQELNRLATTLTGEVMVNQLAEHASAWLRDNARPAALSSFHEEMEARQRADRDKERERKLLERMENERLESRELESVREEVARKAELIKEERRKRRQQLEQQPAQQIQGYSEHRRTARNSSKSLSENSDHGVNVSAGQQAEELCLYLKGEKGRLTKLDKVGGNVAGGSVHFGLLSSGGSNKMVAVAQWIFKTRRSDKRSPSSESIHDASLLMKQLASIEQELNSIQRVPVHPNVVSTYGMTALKGASTVRLLLLEEFVFGNNLTFYLSENLPVDPETLKHLASGVLQALYFMHRHNLVHRDLRDSSVFMDNKGIVKVNGFSVDRRIRDLYCKEDQQQQRFPLAVGRGAKKVDIYRLGLLLLSLVTGGIVQEPVIPRGDGLISPELADFLRRCLDRDEHERWSATQLLEHRWLRQRIERSFLKNETTNEGIGTTPEPEFDHKVDDVAVPFIQTGSGLSRLQSEFSFISVIGTGAFGEVMKVKNNLDGQVYAIKRIKLSEKSRLATRKLVREVKLLSQLNHENVVRYYTSWIEVMTTTISDEQEEEDEEASSVCVAHAKKLKDEEDKKHRLPSLVDALGFGLPENMILPSPAKLPDNSKSDFSISFSSMYPDEGEGNDGEEDEDLCEGAEDDDEDNLFGTSFLPHSSSEGWPDDDDASDTEQSILFEDTNRKEDSTAIDNEKGMDMEKKFEVRMMYIQMEYCDKQTLRSAIDTGLYKDAPRMWRLFREIIEGLVHIHTQGMIHRDLKPVNIFLDSRDHVKIGDFGLATTNVIGSSGKLLDVTNDPILAASSSAAVADMTGHVGTALYIAPEINLGKTSSYTQKVDIYSLGIIFFEMCYHPLNTGMERTKTLTDLRSESIKFPSDFDEALNMQQAHLIRWLLNHDPTQRPNSQELLTSDYLPPPQVEEAELRELLRHTLSNTQSKSYRHLVDACLGQTMSLAQEISYDMEIPRDLMRPSAKKSVRRTLLAHEYVRRAATQVFQRHGGVEIQVGNLLPKGRQQIYDEKATGLVEVMTRGGCVATMPYDHRVTFARFLARTKLNSLRRYCIAPVFREFQIFGYHPREQIECAFDIVTPTSSLVADAEVLSVGSEVLRELSAFKKSSTYDCFFRLSHARLLRGILLNCGVAEEFHAGVCACLREGNWSKMQRAAHMTTILGLSDSTVSSLLNLLEQEGPPSKVSGILRHLARKKNEAATMIKGAMAELEAIVRMAFDIGCRLTMVVSPGLVYNPGHFSSGLVFQLVRRKKTKHRGGYEVMAAGGRYDGLISRFAGAFGLCGNSANSAVAIDQSAVGISLSMDSMIAVMSSLDGGSLKSTPNFGTIDVVLHSESVCTLALRERSELAARLWSIAGIRCMLSDVTSSTDEAHEMAKEMSARFVVVVRDPTSIQQGTPLEARVRALDTNEQQQRFQERRLPIPEVAEFLQKQLQQHHQAAVDGQQDQSSAPSSRLDSTSGSGLATGPGGFSVTPESSSTASHPLSTSASSSATFSRIATNVQVNYHYRFLDKSKFGAAAKKRLESTISAKITPLLCQLAPGSVVEAVALTLPLAVLKSMAAYLDFGGDDEAAFMRSVQTLVERHSRYRKDLADICDELKNLKIHSVGGGTVFALYSTEDHDFRPILAP